MARKKSSGNDSGAKSVEDKVAAFQKLAVARTNKALKAIRQLKYLANTAAYSYGEAEVSAITGALQSAVEEVSQTFADPKAVKSEGFHL